MTPLRTARPPPARVRASIPRDMPFMYQEMMASRRDGRSRIAGHTTSRSQMSPTISQTTCPPTPSRLRIWARSRTGQARAGTSTRSAAGRVPMVSSLEPARFHSPSVS